MCGLLPDHAASVSHILTTAVNPTANAVENITPMRPATKTLPFLQTPQLLTQNISVNFRVQLVREVTDEAK